MKSEDGIVPLMHHQNPKQLHLKQHHKHPKHLPPLQRSLVPPLKRSNHQLVLEPCHRSSLLQHQHQPQHLLQPPHLRQSPPLPADFSSLNQPPLLPNPPLHLQPSSQHPPTTQLPCSTCQHLRSLLARISSRCSATTPPLPLPLHLRLPLHPLLSLSSQSTWVSL